MKKHTKNFHRSLGFFACSLAIVALFTASTLAQLPSTELAGQVVEPGQCKSDGCRCAGPLCAAPAKIVPCSDKTCNSGPCDEPPPSCSGDAPACGNGRIDDGEQCDDGNQTDDDTCANNCECRGGICPVSSKSAPGKSSKNSFFGFGNFVGNIWSAVQESSARFLDSVRTRFNVLDSYFTDDNKERRSGSHTTTSDKPASPKRFGPDTGGGAGRARCEDYVCANGDRFLSCTEEGYPINWFRDPCWRDGVEGSDGDDTSDEPKKPGQDGGDTEDGAEDDTPTRPEGSDDSNDGSDKSARSGFIGMDTGGDGGESADAANPSASEDKSPSFSEGAVENSLSIPTPPPPPQNSVEECENVANEEFLQTKAEIHAWMESEYQRIADEKAACMALNSSVQ